MRVADSNRHVNVDKMTRAELAAYERAMGARIVESGGVFWRRVRPLFYRPLLPFEPLDLDSIKPPPQARWGAWQCAVTDAKRANGSLAFVMFRDAPAYQLEMLDKKRRWEVRAAARHFTIRPLTLPEELQRAYDVFVEFQQRTGYRYRSDRVDPRRYAAWAQEVFRHRGARVLGAFEGAQLRAIGIVHALVDTLIYATFFAAEQALQRHVASLMLHVVRQMAAGLAGVQRIYAGLRKHGPDVTVDQFYLLRGAEVVVQPAYCWVHPVMAWCLRQFRPELLRRLLGEAPESAPQLGVKATTGTSPLRKQ